MKQDKDLCDIFISGIENHEYYNAKHNKKTGNELFGEVKYFAWIIYILLFSPYYKITNKKIYIIYSRIHEKILENSRDSENSVYIGRILSNPKVVFNKNSYFSTFGTKERIELFVNSFFWQVRNNVNIKYFAHGMDFFILYSFIKRMNLNEIVISGHFDRYATWLSLICKKEKISITISQHGALERINLPHKINANTVICFNTNEEEFFKKYILNNDKCIFVNKGFISSLKFYDYEKNDKIVIGIASQDLYTFETLKIVRYLNDKYFSMIKIVIYPHPREDKNIFSEFRKQKNIEIETECRYRNIDILFTFFSSLVYDYLKFESVKIICYPPKEIEMSFFNNKRVTVIKKIEEIDEFLK
jgi:hypothetical protein